MTGRRRERTAQRPRVERIKSWSALLRAMDQERAMVLLASVLYGARAVEIAHGLEQGFASAWLAQLGHDRVVTLPGHTPDLLLSGHHTHPQRPRRGGSTSPATNPGPPWNSSVIPLPDP